MLMKLTPVYNVTYCCQKILLTTYMNVYEKDNFHHILSLIKNLYIKNINIYIKKVVMAWLLYLVLYFNLYNIFKESVFMSPESRQKKVYRISVHESS